MEYTVQSLARLSGVSKRTLRYYDEIGLLIPARNTENGYRIYGPAEVDRLQQILFYRALGVELDGIRSILDAPGFDREQALKEHLTALKLRRANLDRLIGTVEQTMRAQREEIMMTDAEKFEGLKEALISENEAKYGAEVRAAYGDAAVDASNAKLMGMDQAAYAKAETLSAAVNAGLKEAVLQGDPGSEAAQNVCDLHRQWLLCYWPKYTKDMHRGMGELYVADERFAAYYDAIVPGGAAFLKDALELYCK